MSVATMMIVALITLAVVGLFVLNQMLHEFEKTFVWAAYGLVVLLIGFAVYLSFTSPTFTGHAPTPRTAGVSIDESNLLLE